MRRVALSPMIRASDGARGFEACQRVLSQPPGRSRTALSVKRQVVFLPDRPTRPVTPFRAAQCRIAIHGQVGPSA